MAVEIRDLLEAHKGLVQKAGEGLLSGNKEAVVESLAGIAVGLATSSPVLGALGSQVVSRLFASTATRRLERAIAEAEAEDGRQAFVRDIVTPIEALLGEFLAQVVHVHHAMKEELLSGLRSGPGLEEFRQQVTLGLMEIAVHVGSMEVSEGGLGIEVSSAGRNAFVERMTVRTGGVGIRLSR